MISVCYKLCCKVNETWEWDRKNTLRFDIYTNTHTFTHRFIGICFVRRSEEPCQIYFLFFWTFISEGFQLFLPLFFLTFHLFCCSFVCLFDLSLLSVSLLSPLLFPSCLQHITTAICLLACLLAVTLLHRKTGGVCLTHVPSSLLTVTSLLPPLSHSHLISHKMKTYTLLEMYTCTMTICTLGECGDTHRAKWRVHVYMHGCVWLRSEWSKTDVWQWYLSPWLQDTQVNLCLILIDLILF